MKGSNRLSLEALPLSAVLQVDEICGRFETAWQTVEKSGKQPCIEDYVGTLSGAERHALVAELVRIDISYRCRVGQTPQIDDYRRRFPALDSKWAVDVLAGEKEASLPSVTPSYPAGVGIVTRVTPAATPSQPFLLPLRFDDYELLEEVGRGGMGVVYKACQISLNRLVALKMILDSGSLSEEVVQRFHREAKAAAALDHPNIVSIHASGQYEGRPFFTMAYVEGDNLQRVVRTTGQVTPLQAADLVRTVAQAVGFAHQYGIIHRDLKPENVLIDRQGRPRITDFGLAYHPTGQASNERLTHAGQMLGTPAYMAPEQATGKHEELGPATDVYGLGGILYYLLTGQPPFTGRTVGDVLIQVMTAAPKPPRQINPATSPALEQVCLRCLEKDATKRYASTAALVEAIKEAVHPDQDGLPTQQRESPIPAPPTRPPSGQRPLFSTPAPAPVAPPLVAPVPTPLPAPAPVPVVNPWPRRYAFALVGVILAGVVLGVLAEATNWFARPKTDAQTTKNPDNSDKTTDKDGAKPPPPPPQLLPRTKLRTDFGLRVTLLRKRPQQKEFEEALPDKNHLLNLRDDDDVRVRVRVAEPAYVGIWSIHPDGSIVQVFPNTREKGNRLEQDHTYELPQVRKPYARNTGGVDWFWVQATAEPWDAGLDGQVHPYVIFKTHAEHERFKRDIAFRENGTFSEAVLKYQVGP